MVPKFRIGASIDSLLLTDYWLGARSTLSGSRRRIYGKAVSQKPDAFAFRATALATGLFGGGAVSDTDLIVRHSAWPVYSSLLPRTTAQDWLSSNLRGVVSRQRLRFAASIRGTASSATWLSCLACAAYDKEKFGIAHWRVVHQLPGVTFCPEHECALNECCAGCGAAFGGAKLLSMPGWPCQSSGEIRTTTKGGVRTKTWTG